MTSASARADAPGASVQIWPVEAVARLTASPIFLDSHLNTADRSEWMPRLGDIGDNRPRSAEAVSIPRVSWLTLEYRGNFECAGNHECTRRLGCAGGLECKGGLERTRDVGTVPLHGNVRFREPPNDPDHVKKVT